jgi:hypothetical protein
MSRFKSKRFCVIVALASIKIIILSVVVGINFYQGDPINLSGLAACFGSITIEGAAYAYLETVRPSGFNKEGGKLL